MKPTRQTCEKEIARAIDEATTEGFRSGTDFGYCIGWGEGLREAAAEE